jgi:hypothetical protein
LLVEAVAADTAEGAVMAALVAEASMVEVSIVERLAAAHGLPAEAFAAADLAADTAGVMAVMEVVTGTAVMVDMATTMDQTSQVA